MKQAAKVVAAQKREEKQFVRRARVMVQEATQVVVQQVVRVEPVPDLMAEDVVLDMVTAQMDKLDGTGQVQVTAMGMWRQRMY